MSKRINIFTSEHVSPGHPDKVMDVIAESIVDYHFENSSKARVAVDGAIKNGTIFLGGEITSEVEPDYEEIVALAIRKSGYTSNLCPDFNEDTFALTYLFDTQSPDIAQGVDCHEEDKGAGDIGIMFGGAILEAPDFTGHSHYIAKVLSKGLHDQVVDLSLEWGRPDIKTQVSIRYEDKVPVAVDNVVVCISHSEDKDLEEIREEITKYVGKQLDIYNQELVNLGRDTLLVEDTKVLVNPTGRFAVFGPASDAGEVGRKIVVDQMGGHFSVGGGNLNGCL